LTKRQKGPSQVLDVYVNVNYNNAATKPRIKMGWPTGFRERIGDLYLAKTYSITELAQEFAVTPRTIRFYEDRGLIKPKRQGQARVYRAGDRVRLMMILRGKRLGFSLDEILELLELYRLPDSGLEQTTRTLARVDERISALERQRRDIDAALGELTDVALQLRSQLSNLTDKRHAQAAQ
jgi:DNA-binding transcriptional MerR regulator